MRHFLKDTNLYRITQQKHVDYEIRKSLKGPAMSASCFTVPSEHCSGREIRVKPLDSSSELSALCDERKKFLDLRNTKRGWRSLGPRIVTDLQTRCNPNTPIHRHPYTRIHTVFENVNNASSFLSEINYTTIYTTRTRRLFLNMVRQKLQ